MPIISNLIDAVAIKKLIKVKQNRDGFFQADDSSKKMNEQICFVLPNITMIELFCLFFGRIRG